MSIHQIIYTSCKRGIRGVNDGQQIFSHDAAFPEGAIEAVKGMFTYIMPALEPGQVMTEELATQQPQAFLYRRLETGHCALALNTYLGRDYMGSAGRFGNQLSHVLLFQPEDSELYPCQYYGSGMLRSSMTFEEVNNPHEPQPLPTPWLIAGNAVTVEAVTDFLAQGRMEIYQNMLWAMLAYESHRKRLVICDAPENLILWIGALEFALPRRMAWNINFTTYEYDPALSESQICGVVPRGTRFDPETAQQHFTFDLLEGNCPEFDKDPEFFDFIDTAMSFSYDSIQDFHSFLDRCGYDKADQGLYEAYALYALLSDGLGDSSQKRLEMALHFAGAHGDEAMNQQVLTNLLNHRQDLLKASQEGFQTASTFIGKCTALLTGAQRTVVQELLVDRLLYGCLDPRWSQEQFRENESLVRELGHKCQLDLPALLMAPENREKLLMVGTRIQEPWRLELLLTILREYVKAGELPADVLECEGSVGSVYRDLIHGRASRGGEEAVALSRQILLGYKEQPAYELVAMLCLDRSLGEIGTELSLLDRLWEEFNSRVFARGLKATGDLWQVLVSRSMADRLMAGYHQCLSGAREGREASQVYALMTQKLESGNLTNLLPGATEAYYQCLTQLPDRNTYEQKTELFRIATRSPLLLPQATIFELEKELLDPLRLDRLDNQDRKLCREMIDYNLSMAMKLPRKLLPISIGLVYETARGERDLLADVSARLKEAGKKQLDLTALSSRTAQDYLQWILPRYTELCQSSEAMERLFYVHIMTEEQTEWFLQEALEDYAKESKRDNRALVAFLALVLTEGNDRVLKSLTKIVKKLNKGRQEDLRQAMEKTWGTDGVLMVTWKRILEEAQAPNPVLEGISNFFRRKNKGSSD